MRPNQIQKSLYSKGKSETRWKDNSHNENICKLSNWQSINLQNIEAAHPAQYQKNQTTQSKNGLAT